MTDFSYLQGKKVCVALSGGVDSVCLFHQLLKERQIVGFSLCAVHCEHGIRGEESKGDMAFVTKLCQSASVPLIVYEEDCVALAKTQKISLETAARNFRKSAFEKALTHFQADCIATAHHLGDEAETVLFRLARGTSLTGVKGMSEKEEKIVTLEELLALPKDEPIAISIEDDKIYCARETELLTFEGTPDSVREFLCDTERKFIMHDCKSSYHALSNIEFTNCHFDIMLAAYVLNAGEGSFDLERLAMANLSLVLDENTNRAPIIYEIYKILKQKIEDLHFEKLFYEIEMPLAHVLFEMEHEGFKIDREGLLNYGLRLDETVNELADRIYGYAGKEFNINSPKQLGEILFETLMLPHGKKTKTGYSTNAEVLDKLRAYHPIIQDILDYRQVMKLKGTYVDGFIKLLTEESKIHTTFKQTGTATGRLSSAEPNLQNIPIRTTLGRELRHYFIPKNENYVLVDADYSQIELRLLAAISGDENMIGAFLSGVDIHTSTASNVFHVPENMVTSELRKRAKAVNFGIVYGIGEFSLSDDLHISMKEAKEYIESYKASYPLVDKYLKDIVAEGYEHGFVSTLYGRRRYIPELLGQNKMLKKFGERVAMNSPIQGTAADIIKVAMINVNRRLKEEGIDAKLILQVHDELLVEAHKSCSDIASKILREEMENAIQLPVPLSVELTIGETWYDNKQKQACFGRLVSQTVEKAALPQV